MLTPERVDIETLIAWQIGEAKNARVHENDHTVRRRDEVLDALRELQRAKSGEFVTLPKSADEAELMAKVGLSWLEVNAPERLKRPSP